MVYTFARVTWRSILAGALLLAIYPSVAQSHIERFAVRHGPSGELLSAIQAKAAASAIELSCKLIRFAAIKARRRKAGGEIAKAGFSKYRSEERVKCKGRKIRCWRFCFFWR
jgi:hypothetical protein